MSHAVTLFCNRGRLETENLPPNLPCRESAHAQKPFMISLPLQRLLLLPFLALTSYPSFLFDAREVSIPRFEKEEIVPKPHDPMKIEVPPDGRIYFTERSCLLKSLDPSSGRVELVGRAPSVRYGELGLMGLKLDSDFENNRRLYRFFCPKAKTIICVSRFLSSKREISISIRKS